MAEKTISTSSGKKLIVDRTNFKQSQTALKMNLKL